MKVKFATGCFDNFEGTQEELDKLISEITKHIQASPLAGLEGEVVAISVEKALEDGLIDMEDQNEAQVQSPRVLH